MLKTSDCPVPHRSVTDDIRQTSHVAVHVVCGSLDIGTKLQHFI